MIKTIEFENILPFNSNIKLMFLIDVPIKNTPIMIIILITYGILS